jgi:hypothetical protein
MKSAPTLEQMSIPQRIEAYYQAAIELFDYLGGPVIFERVFELAEDEENFEMLAGIKKALEHKAGISN